MAWWIPILIFFARIGDVSVGTVRTMIVVSGHKWLAVTLGFFEVVIWLVAAGWAFKYISNPFAVIGYAGGYSTGILVGMWLENKLAIGLRTVRVINPDQNVDVASELRLRGFRVTRLNGGGMRGPVEVSFLVVKRRRLRALQEMLSDLAPDSFVTVERVDRADGGDFTYSRFARRSWERVVPILK